jgi:hypothetical protein
MFIIAAAASSLAASALELLPAISLLLHVPAGRRGRINSSKVLNQEQPK